MSEMLSIQSSVPLPKRSRGVLPSKPRKYPFDQMEVGQMFFIPNKTKNTLHTYFSSVGKRMGIKLATRLVHMYETDEGWALCEAGDEGAVPGIGVWRTA
jgi:hypothetical protein